MVVATNSNPTPAIAIYLRRWEIETLFVCLKSKGFRFGDMHWVLKERITKSMALLVIGFVWAHKTGEWRVLLCSTLMPGSMVRFASTLCCATLIRVFALLQQSLFLVCKYSVVVGRQTQCFWQHHQRK